MQKELDDMLPELDKKLVDCKHTVTLIKLLDTKIECYGEDPELYWRRAHCYREIEMFLEATDDLQRAADLRPYNEASISNKSFYDRMVYVFRNLGLDFN